jgi:hypothetical protein
VACPARSEWPANSQDKLAGEHIIDVDNGVYRASFIALYSGHQLTAPPIRALTTGNQSGRIADINPDSH